MSKEYFYSLNESYSKAGEFLDSHRDILQEELRNNPDPETKRKILEDLKWLTTQSRNMHYYHTLHLDKVMGFAGILISAAVVSRMGAQDTTKHIEENSDAGYDEDDEIS